jgi:FkbM family methyltransferase
MLDEVSDRGAAVSRAIQMSWVSYAQNGEDVRLHRAFRDQSNGFFIDVGANDPVDCSITKHFYDVGWSGINIEPAPAPFARIAKERKRDINLNVGCSNRPGSMTLYAARGATGLSTFTAEEAAIHEKKGFEFEAITTSVRTLASICDEHVKNRSIDFLSIDVEGHEREVLEGADFRRFRPRVVVIEATRPNTTEPTHDRWEDLVLCHDYTFAVFDGLNRYYVRNEDERLAPVLALAPNIFDDYSPYIYQRRIDALEAELLGYRVAGVVLRSAAGVARGVGTFARWVGTVGRRGSPTRREGS